MSVMLWDLPWVRALLKAIRPVAPDTVITAYVTLRGGEITEVTVDLDRPVRWTIVTEVKP